jgi:signal transduction histidine kinase
MSEDFSLLLASSVHDMKNSLGMLLTSLDELTSDMSDMTDAQRRQFAILQGEASRIRNDLIYLLGLYRIQVDDLVVNIDEVLVDDFVDQQIAQNSLLFTMRNINVVVHCEPGLTGFFDDELIAGVLSNVLVNAARYTRSTIEISAYNDAGWLCVDVIDDGAGFPQDMIDQSKDLTRAIDFKTGSTHLGLHFAAKIAALHKANDGRTGTVEISNKSVNGQGCFRLRLP